MSDELGDDPIGANGGAAAAGKVAADAGANAIAQSQAQTSDKQLPGVTVRAKASSKKPQASTTTSASTTGGGGSSGVSQVNSPAAKDWQDNEEAVNLEHFVFDDIGRHKWQYQHQDQPPGVDPNATMTFKDRINVFLSMASVAVIADAPQIAVTKTAVVNGKWTYGAFKTETKWANQFAKRGWTSEKVTEAITKGKPYSAVNNVNKANGATRYVHPTTGQSVVIDNITRELLQVGGPGFIW